MVFGSWRVNITWKSFQNDSGVILELLEIDSGSFFNVKIHNLNKSLDLKLIFYKIWEFWSDISTSSNKSGPGTHFKMCSRSWQYWRFEYHQKLLTQKWSCAISKLTYLIFVVFLFDINCHECQKCISWKFICCVQLKSNSAGVQDRIYAWNRVLLVSWKRIAWEFIFAVHGCWCRTPKTNFQEMRFLTVQKKV